MSSSLAKKLGAKVKMRAILLGAPAQVIDAMRSPTLALRSRLRGSFDFIHVFLKREKRLRDAFRRLKPHLTATGMLWISWPKKNQMNTDLTMKKIIKIGYDCGLVESKCVSVNPVWSGIKFTFPKKGKIYQNSYGQLKHSAGSKRSRVR